MTETIAPPNYTQIPNVLLDDYLRSLTPAEFKLAMAISRQTFGWHRDEAELSFSRLEDLTGLTRQGIFNSVGKLMEQGLLSRRKHGKSFLYRLLISTEEDDTSFNSVEQSGTNCKLSLQDEKAPTVNSVYTSPAPSFNSVEQSDAPSFNSVERHRSTELTKKKKKKKEKSKEGERDAATRATALAAQEPLPPSPPDSSAEPAPPAPPAQKQPRSKRSQQTGPLDPRFMPDGLAEAGAPPNGYEVYREVFKLIPTKFQIETMNGT